MKDKKIAALYIRVSTDAQFEEGYSVDAQKELLLAYCKSKKITNCEFYIDGGFTGSNISRPLMQKLIDDCKNEKITHVIVYKLDRLSRSQKDTLYLIEDVFLPHNVDFISLNESFDTSSPFGRAMIGILSVFAQLERENIKMRTRMGMRERVKTGLWMGGGRVPFGYDYDKSLGVLVPNTDANKVKQMYQLYIDGYSPDKIATMMGLKYDRLVTQILTRKTNAGYIVYNGEEYLGKHESIISLEMYNQTMDVMRERSVQRIVTSGYLLTGLVYCGKCGAKMRYQKWGQNGSKLICYSQQTSKKYLIKDPNCDNEKNWADEVEDVVIKNLFKLSNDIVEKNNLHLQRENTLDILKSQISAYTSQIKKLYDLYSKSNDDLLLETIEEKKKELDKIIEQANKEQIRNKIDEKTTQTRETLKTIESAWDYLNVTEKQKIVRECIDKIIITDNHVDVVYKQLF